VENNPEPLGLSGGC
jgi:hypothetical protein